MNKKIPSNIAQSLIELIKASDFYNKIQITFNHSDDTFNTETFYFYEGQWGHSIYKEGGAQTETIQDTQMIEDENILIKRLDTLETDAQVAIAGNSSQHILTIKL